MRTSIQKWGNSLAVRIPHTLAKEAGMTSGTAVEMTLEKGKLVLAPIKEPEFSLEELMKGVTKENRHSEIDWGKRVGREVW
jgi:antitoxin MazE